MTETWLLSLIAIAVLFLSTNPSQSHDWYPPSCCHGDDCHKARAYKDSEDFWQFFVKETGKWAIVPMSQIRTTPTPPDMSCHVCYKVGVPNDTVYVYCFFPCGAGS